MYKKKLKIKNKKPPDPTHVKIIIVTQCYICTPLRLKISPITLRIDVLKK